jgi:hypothetical protein
MHPNNRVGRVHPNNLGSQVYPNNRGSQVHPNDWGSWVQFGQSRRCARALPLRLPENLTSPIVGVYN